MGKISRRDFLKQASIIAGIVLLPEATSNLIAGSVDPETDEDLEGKIIPNNTGAWAVKREWTRSEKKLFARWFENIYDKKSNGTATQRAAKIPYILQNQSINLLLDDNFSSHNNDYKMFDEATLSVMNSANACGTFPILMHMYYCAIRGLPATFTKVEGNGGDIRYSRGNSPTRLLDPVSYGGSLKGFIKEIFFGDNNYTTGNWRTAPDLEETDTVPVSISPETTIPGLTLLYNTDGHGLAIGKINDLGEVKILDGHPDGSITSGQTLAALQTVGESVVEDRKETWYGGWRMRRLAKTIRDKEGRVIGINPLTNEEMEDHGFSEEQYEDMIAMKNSEPVTINGKEEQVNSFPEYAQKKLQTTTAIDIKILIQDWTQQLQRLFSERAVFVQQGWEDVLSNGPITLPDNKNIYQAEGRWEKWSSPSSDCDRKGGYFLTADRLDAIVRDFEPAKTQITGFKAGSRRELAAAIIEEKRKAFEQAKIEYKTSSGRKVILNLNDIESRLFKISFDPNHAPELRWGATDEMDGSSGYPGKSTPLASGGFMSAQESYRREQGLRFRMTRKPGYTPLESSDNPKGPLKELLEERLKKYLK